MRSKSKVIKSDPSGRLAGNCSFPVEDQAHLFAPFTPAAFFGIAACGRIRNNL